MLFWTDPGSSTQQHSSRIANLPVIVETTEVKTMQDARHRLRRKDELISIMQSMNEIAVSLTIMSGI